MVKVRVIQYFQYFLDCVDLIKQLIHTIARRKNSLQDLSDLTEMLIVKNRTDQLENTYFLLDCSRKLKRKHDKASFFGSATLAFANIWKCTQQTMSESKIPLGGSNTCHVSPVRIPTSILIYPREDFQNDNQHSKKSYSINKIYYHGFIFLVSLISFI